MRMAKFLILMAVMVGVAGPSKVQAAEPAAVKPAVSEFGPEGTWSTTCDIDRMTDAKSCRMMIYRQLEEGRETEVVALSIIPMGHDYNLFVTAGRGLVQNCALRVDRLPRVETTVASLGMCMFPNFVAGKILDYFRNGSTILLRINFVRGGRRDIDFPLSGFGRNFEEMLRSLN
ncbi:Invasion associated locus B family protein [uncultured Gammaproteobacteria bacterium]